MTPDPTERVPTQSAKAYSHEAALDQSHFADAVEMLIIGPLERLRSQTVTEVERYVSALQGDSTVDLTTLDGKLNQVQGLGTDLREHLSSVGEIAEDSVRRVRELEGSIALLSPLPDKAAALESSLDEANRSLADLTALTDAQRAILRRVLIALWAVVGGLVLMVAVGVVLLVAGR